jgi:hypothetical protein
MVPVKLDEQECLELEISPDIPPAVTYFKKT